MQIQIYVIYCFGYGIVIGVEFVEFWLVGGGVVDQFDWCVFVWMLGFGVDNMVQVGGYYGYVDFVLYVWIEYGIYYYGGVFGCEVIDGVVDFVEFGYCEVGIGGDVDQDVVGVGQVYIVQQWVLDGGFSSGLGVVIVMCGVCVYYCQIYF